MLRGVFSTLGANGREVWKYDTRSGTTSGYRSGNRAGGISDAMLYNKIVTKNRLQIWYHVWLQIWYHVWYQIMSQNWWQIWYHVCCVEWKLLKETM